MDAFARRRIIIGSRKLQRASVREREDSLGNSLSKGQLADNDSRVVILQRSRQNLGGTGALPVYQHGHRHIDGMAVVGIVNRLGNSFSLKAYQRIPLRQDIIRDIL